MLDALPGRSGNQRALRLPLSFRPCPFSGALQPDRALVPHCSLLLRKGRPQGAGSNPENGPSRPDRNGADDRPWHRFGIRPGIPGHRFGIRPRRSACGVRPQRHAALGRRAARHHPAPHALGLCDGATWAYRRHRPHGSLCRWTKMGRMSTGHQRRMNDHPLTAMLHPAVWRELDTLC